MKYWAYLNDEVSQQSYTEEQLKQLPGFSADILICSETSAVSAEPDWRPVKELLPHLFRPKAPNFAKFRPKPPVPAAPVQPVQQQEMPQETLPIPNVLPVGINTMPMGQFYQGNVQMPVQNQPQQAPAQNDFSRELLAQLESLTTKINSLENKIVEQEKELAEAYKAQEDYYNPPTLISEPQNEQEDDVLEIPFDNDFVMPFDAGKSSEEIAKEAEEILSNPTSAEIEEYNTDDQKTELMTFGSDIQNILEDTIRQDIKAQEQKKKKKTETEDKPIIAEDLISRTTLSFPANDETEEDKEEDIIEETPSDELNIDNLDEILEQQKPEEESKEEKKEEVSEEKPAEETKEETAKEEVKEEKAEEPKEQVSEETAEEKQAEEESTEEKKEEVSEEKPVEEVKEEEKTEEQVSEETAEEKPAEEETTEEKKEEVSEEDKEEDDDDYDSIEETKTETESEEEKPMDEIPTEGISKEPVVEENIEMTEEEISEKREENLSEHDKEETVTMGVSISEDETTAAVLDEIAQEKSNYAESETEPTPEQLFEELENTAQQQSAEEQFNVDEVIEGNDNQSVSGENETVSEEQPESETEDKTEEETTEENKEEVSEENAEEKAEEEQVSEESAEEKPVEETPVDNAENAENNEELSQDLPKEDEFLKTFTTSVEEVFLDQPTAIISDYVPPSDDTQKLAPKADATSSTMMETIRREKPSDIKTIPLVSGAMGQEIWSSPYVESATAELRKKSKIADFFKFSLIVVIVISFIIIALSGLAVLGIVPEKYSPLHKVVYSLQKSPEENVVVVEDEEMEPEIAEENNIAAAPVEPETEPQNEVEQVSQEDIVISSIKGYLLKDGRTLESKILAEHPNLNGELEWTLYPTEEENVYSIAVKLPPNNAGQSFSYRFNYNIADKTLIPTTSEAKSIMEK